MINNVKNTSNRIRFARKRYVLSLLLCILLTSCTMPDRLMDMPEIKGFIKQIKKEYVGLKKVEVHKPQNAPYLSITYQLKDNVNEDTIFNIYNESKDFVLKSGIMKKITETSGRPRDIRIAFYTPDIIYEYSSSYYKANTTIYYDDRYNVIDNYETWVFEKMKRRDKE